MGWIFEHTWGRVIVASLLLTLHGSVDGFAKLRDWRRRPRGVRWRPIWSHLLGFVSLIILYSLIASDGRSVLNGLGNQIGIVLCVLAITIRWVGWGGKPIRHADLVMRTMFYAALPLVVGSPWSAVGFTLPQALIAANEVNRRNQALVKSQSLGER